MVRRRKRSLGKARDAKGVFGFDPRQKTKEATIVTPLLDWTESPFVAAYFAFVKKVDSSQQTEGKRFVYGINEDIKRWYLKTVHVSKNKSFSNEELFIDFPTIKAHENARFLAQSGVLTKALKGEDVKKIVQLCYHETNHRDRIVLVEISIGDGEREECLRDLNKMNINHASMFPDIDGSAIFCNLRLEINKY